MPYASATSVDRTALLEFAAARHHGVLITWRRDGRPQASPVTCGVHDGQILVASYPQRAKVANIRRDPRVSMCLLSAEFDGPYVQVDGHATVLDLPDAVQPLVDYFRAVAGEHPDWAEYREAMVRQGKCLIRVEIDQWGPIATGGFPPPAQ